MADVRHATAGEPHQKAFFKAFGSADDSDDENQKPDQCNWGTSSSIAGTGVAGVLPEELRKRFPDHKDGRESVKKAIQEFCHKHSKSCSVIDKGCSKTVIFQCPFRHSVDDLKRKWKSKRQIHRPGAPAARTATEEENDGENREIVCPFHLIARFRSRGDLFFWEVDEEGAEPWHDGERCPSTHISPGWMISQHPEFLTAMMKAKKDRPNRPKLVKELASGKGGNRKLSVTTDQIRYAEKLYNEDLETGLQASIQRIPEWLRQLIASNLGGDHEDGRELVGEPGGVEAEGEGEIQVGGSGPWVPVTSSDIFGDSDEEEEGESRGEEGGGKGGRGMECGREGRGGGEPGRGEGGGGTRDEEGGGEHRLRIRG